MFTHTHLIVASLYPKQTIKLEFPYSGITIVSLSASCGCSDVSDDKEEQKVKVTYTAQEIPVHLLDKQGVTTEKFITVKYYIDDPAKEQILKLTFKATIINGKSK